MRSGGIFDFDTKHERLVEVLRELESPDIWSNPQQAQDLGKERGQLELVVNGVIELTRGLADAEELLLMAIEEDDSETVDIVANDVNAYEKHVADLEFRRMFSGKMDANNAFFGYSIGFWGDGSTRLGVDD